MNRNTQKLGAIVAAQMKKTAGAAVPLTVSLGTINKNLSLSVDGLNDAIPKGEYMIDIAFSADSYYTAENSAHKHRLPAAFRALKSGDRVLVIWCGYEPIVASVITKS